MAELIYVVPAPGGRVRQPERNSSVMPQEGAWVPRDAYYDRLLASGDLQPGAPPSAENPDPAERAEATHTTSGRGRRAHAASSED